MSIDPAGCRRAQVQLSWIPVALTSSVRRSLSARISAARCTGVLEVAISPCVRLGERAHGFCVEAVDDFARRARRRKLTVPSERDESGQPRLADRRYRGQRWIDRIAGNTERFEAARQNLRQHRGIEKPEVCMAAHQVGDSRRGAFVRNMRHARAGQHVEQFPRNVLSAAGAAGHHVEHTGFRFCDGDQFLRVAGRHRRMSDQDVRPRDEIADGREIARGHVRWRRVHQMRGGDGPASRDEQRIAVWRRFGNVIGAHRAGRAGTVVHDDRLPERFGKFLRNRAPGDVDAAAGGIRYDDAQRLRRISLCSRQRCIEQQRGRANAKYAEFFIHVQRLRSR